MLTLPFKMVANAMFYALKTLLKIYLIAEFIKKLLFLFLTKLLKIY